METLRSPIIDWGVAARPLAGQERSGDAYIVREWGNRALASAIDGLGHGADAAEVARIAVDTLTDTSVESADVVSLMKRCHEALLRTRGVVLSLAVFDATEQTLTWLGIGNVDGILFRADHRGGQASESLLQRGGVVGYQLPPLRPSTIPVYRGDLLIFSTDGILSGFGKDVNPEDPPQQIADRIIARYSRETDDALVLAARYVYGAL